MKTFNVNLIVEADDNDATEEFIERVIESCFDSYDGYVATDVSASSIDETEEIEPPSFEEAQGEFNSYNAVLNG